MNVNRLKILIIICLFLVISGCGGNRCDTIEKDAVNAADAVKKYFSNPFNDTMPKLSDLVGFSSKNTVVIGGDIDQIVIMVSNDKRKCEKGSKYIISIPPGEKDGWQK